MAQIPSLVPDADIKTQVAANLKVVSEASLPPHWDTIIPQASTQALQDIQDRLTNRGFSLAQVGAWDRLIEFHRDMAAYHALVKGAALEQYDPTFLKMMDRRNELATLMLTCNGIAQTPGGPVQTVESFWPAINFGRQTSTADLFSLDPTDDRAGNVTQF